MQILPRSDDLYLYRYAFSEEIDFGGKKWLSDKSIHNELLWIMNY